MLIVLVESLAALLGNSPYGADHGLKNFEFKIYFAGPKGDLARPSKETAKRRCFGASLMC